MKRTKRTSVKDRSPLDDLFRKTGPTEKKAGERKSADRSTTKAGTTRQTTILLSDEQLDWLDQKCTEARSQGGKPIRKAALIRSLLELAMSAPVDLKGLQDEGQLVERLAQALKTK